MADMPPTVPDAPSGFLARWSQRKAQVRDGEPVPADVVAAPVPAVEPVAPATSAVEPAPAEPAPAAAAPAPTLAEVATLTHDSDYGRFVAAGVDDGVKRAALKKLFSDPRFNVMDGLDTYIDDYGRPDPIPESMLRRLNQSAFLGLFDHEADPPPSPIPTPPAAAAAPDENADLPLQPDHAAGRPGAAEGAGP